MHPHDIPYIQDIAGSIDHCSVAVSPAMSVRNALTELSCRYNIDGELEELKLLDRSKVYEERKEYKYLFCSRGEFATEQVYDEKGKLVEIPVKYKDEFDETGHLKTRTYSQLAEIEKYSHNEDLHNQVIRLEQIFERIELKKEYKEYYNHDRKLVCQTYQAYDMNNPLNIQIDIQLIHYYDGANICETIQTYMDCFSFGVIRSVYSNYRRSNWGKVEIFFRERNDEQERLVQTIKREFAFKPEEIAPLYEKYNMLKKKRIGCTSILMHF